MGTPDFAVPSLQALIDSEDEVVGVMSQPDKPAGRHMALHAPPVKECALAHAIPVFQPQKIRTPEALEHLKRWQPDLIIVVAYGKILPNTILGLPAHGCMNVHASLLPKYRGAAPLQWAIARGETHSGVTIMQISEQMDAGDILHQVSVALEADETGGRLHDKLATLGAQALGEALSLFKQGKLTSTPQDEDAVTYAPMLQKEDGNIGWNQDAASIEQRIRAFSPWPSSYTSLGNKRLKILSAGISKSEAARAAQPGVILNVLEDSLIVATGKGHLQIHTVQLEGKKVMSISEFLKGRSIKPGDHLGG